MAFASLDELIERVRILACLDGAFGGEVAPDGGGYIINRVAGAQMEPMDGLVVAPGTGIGGKALLLGRPLRVTDYRRSPSITHEFDRPVEEARLRSMFAIPVLLDGTPRAMLYGALRKATPMSDRQLDAAHRLLSEYKFALRVDDEVARTVAELEAAEPAARLREQLREIHAEATAIADQVSDPDLRRRLESLSRRALPDAPPPPGATLTKRELDVAAQVAVGLSNADVADRLGLTEGTVKSYLKSAMRKAGVHNRTALVATCRRAGLLP